MQKSKKATIIISIILLIIAAGIFIVFNSNKVLGLIGVGEKAPVFVFDVAKQPGWWAAKNYNAQAAAREDGKNYKGDTPIDEMPVATIHVFRGVEGDRRTDCFVSFSYYDHQADFTKLKAEKDAGMSSGDLKMSNIGETELTMNVFGSEKTFLTNNYELSGAGSETSMKGMSYGWVETSGGYIQVSGVCPTGGELNQIADASHTISLINQ